MPQASWHLNRRTFLRGAGLALALPWLEAMSHAAPPAQRPKRFCAFFFGNGVALPGKNQAHFEDWHWFPHTDGTDYKLNRSLDPLEPHRADIRTNLTNSISLDQVIARRYASQTRIHSLVLSSQGGVGSKSRSTTISF